jgi:hypothetical protein
VRSAPCTWRRGAWSSWLSLKTKVVSKPVATVFSGFVLKIRCDSFSRFGLQTSGGGFPGLGLKTGSYGLVICTPKSQRRFPGLGFKTKRATVYRLYHKIDRRMKTAQGMHRDLAACFRWKQVELGFFSLPQNWQRRNGGWCMWHHRGGHVEIKMTRTG